MNASILIIEDDATLRRVLEDNFTAEGYAVRSAADGEAGLQAARCDKPDLIVLDLMLPEINGYEICRLIRKDGLDMPIVMLTAKSLESDVVLGLNLGADDYVTKPFRIRELLARVNAFIRRRRARLYKDYTFGHCRLDLGSHVLVRAGVEIPLAPKEFGLLALMVRKPGRVLTRDDILRNVWGDSMFVTHRSVDRCITTLRRKIEPDPRNPTYIQTVRDVGYRFDLPDGEPGA